MSRRCSAVELRARDLQRPHGEGWSGTADLHRALPAPQAGGTLSSLVPDAVSTRPSGLAHHKLGVIDGTCTRYGVGHGHAARLFAFDHRMEPLPGLAPGSAVYGTAVLLLDDSDVKLETRTGLAPAQT